MAARSRSVLVVGAGTFGTTVALELARRAYRVTVLDPGPLPHPDASSTDISKAIRMDYGSDELYMELAERALARWREWNRAWTTPLYHETGVMFLARETMRPGGFEHDSHALLRRRGHRPERVGPDALARRFPAWRAEAYPDGYFNPDGGWAESRKVVAWLIDRARAAGIEFREGERFARLAEAGSRVAGVVTARGERLRADMVIVAAGAWTPALLPHLAGRIRAVGQPVLHFRPADPEPYRAPRFPVWGADISRTGWYGFPATADGVVKVANHGPGVETDPHGPRAVPSEAEARFREFLRESLPGLADAPLVGSRLCLYEDAWDGNFWIDHDPERPGLVVASGGSGHGFKFAPVLGEIVADVVERRPRPEASRFAWREPGPPRVEQARFSRD